MDPCQLNAHHVSVQQLPRLYITIMERVLLAALIIIMHQVSLFKLKILNILKRKSMSKL